MINLKTGTFYRNEMNKLYLHARIRINLKTTMLNERSQIHKDTEFITPFIQSSNTGKTKL